MKLLFIHECFGAFGGAESNMFHTATELKCRGHEVGIVHGPSTGKAEAEWQNLFQERFVLDGGKAVTKVIERFLPDVVYIHKMAENEVLEALLASRRPVVRMVHDHETYCLRGCRYGHFSRKICTRPMSAFCIIPCGGFIGRNSAGGFPVKWISYFKRRKELRTNRQFDRLIVATNYMKDELMRNHVKEGQIEIHAPTPPMAENAAKQITAKSNLLIYSGQIIRGKGVDVLLLALEKVKSAFKCLIFGDGSHREYCEALSRKLGLSERVIFKGYVSQSELQSYYAQASIMMMSSVWAEPFGAAGLEGMHHALPVVAFDAGGIKEWLLEGENGFLIPWMNTELYAARLDQLLNDKNLAKKMGEAGRKMVNERFNFSSYVDGLEDMFVRVIKSHA